MHVVAWRCSAASRSPAKLVAGRRRTYKSVRQFHCAHAALLSVVPPSDSAKADNSVDAKEQYHHNGSSISTNSDRLASSSHTGPENAEPRPPVTVSSRSKEKSADHGSFTSRSQRNSKPDGIPAVVIPAWFQVCNVRLREHHEALSTHDVRVNTQSGQSLFMWRGQKLKSSSQPFEISQEGYLERFAQLPDGFGEHSLSEAQWTEMAVSARAGLHVYRPNPSESFVARKAHLILHCPVDGSGYFLNSVVEHLAQQERADLICLDAQDLAHIGGEYMRESSDASSNSIWSLAYDSHHELSPANQGGSSESDDAEDATEFFNGMTGGPFSQSGPSSTNARGPLQISSATMIPISVGSNLGELRRIAEKAMAFISPFNSPNNNRSNGRGSLSTVLGPSSPSRQWQDQKLTTLFESLIDAAKFKRAASKSALLQTHSADTLPAGTEAVPFNERIGEEGEIPEEVKQRRHLSHQEMTEIDVSIREECSQLRSKTIIHVKDYKEIEATEQGHRLLDKLTEVIQNRRKRGESIMIVGTTSSADLTPELSVEGFQHLQSEGDDLLYRTVFVTPDVPGQAATFYERHEHLRIGQVNVRNLLEAIRHINPDFDAMSCGMRLSEFNKTVSHPHLKDHIMSFDEIHRIAIITFGIYLRERRERKEAIHLGPLHIAAAVEVLGASDKAKMEWVEKERNIQNSSPAAGQSATASSEDRLKTLRKWSNAHEQKLLGGVINPENIMTTFEDVHVPPETIEALKTLTTLSLTRPEAFKYGVLATDKISGLLLYGPPGTGKTLLAKAVAKESGATVLEVSGSEIYDMYVGESEKNVKAIFSLAEKLSPCVVFLDEADAIFGSRGSNHERKTHREILNQFLREWDGMNQLSAFIMVATNRPYDLDDAVLRRLPRRLLVELPVEKDREAILRIHLKNEILDPSVSLANLAANTPLYSGSDLKNLAVAAALACVREENATAAAEQQDNVAWVYPDKRILMQRHFDKAMEEISASVSEDMSSLAAIKKFDEQYGDRRGRRKKHVYGFVTGAGERVVDAAKVRA